jgi:hypothetical protein
LVEIPRDLSKFFEGEGCIEEDDHGGVSTNSIVRESSSNREWRTSCHNCGDEAVKGFSVPVVILKLVDYIN